MMLKQYFILNALSPSGSFTCETNVHLYSDTIKKCIL